MRPLRKGEISGQPLNAGVALISVLVSVMILSILLFEFQYASMLEHRLSYNDLNQLKAYYLAKAGTRVGLLRLNLYLRARKDPTLKKNLQGANRYLDQIWSLRLPPFPPEASKVKKLNAEDKTAAEKLLKQTRFSEGQYDLKISSESSKINLNFLQVGNATDFDTRAFLSPPPKSLQQHTALQFVNLVENILRESNDPFDEYGPVKSEELVFDIMDWISPGNNRLLGGGKDAFYETQKPPYRAKKQKFYTLDELKLVRNMSDSLFQKIKPFVTVYSQDGKININNSSAQVLRAIYRDFTDDDLEKLEEQRLKTGGFSSEKEFVDFVSQTLGRSGFSKLYNDEKNYPFSVGNESFLVESSGVLIRSGSEIRKTIRVGVGMVNNQAAVDSKKSKADCDKDPFTFFDIRQNVCRGRPKDRGECDNILGQWSQSTLTCTIQWYDGQAFPIKYPPPDTKGFDKRKEPNSLKVFYWSES